MVNKKGWMIIVEASIAVLIMFSFLFAMISQRAQTDDKTFFYEKLNNLKQFVLENPNARPSGDQIAILDCPDCALPGNVPKNAEVYTTEIIKPGENIKIYLWN
ncbi:MAG: hypothetical protein ABH817_00110 [archaeon]